MDISPVILWAIFGLVLIITELFTLSFVLIFFGVSALLVSLIKHFGLDNLSAEIFIFALVGLLSLFIFRKKVVSSVRSDQVAEWDANKKLTLTEDIPSGKSARIVYQGSTWTAHNETSRELKKGDVVFIEKTDGINLYVNAVAKLNQEE